MMYDLAFNPRQPRDRYGRWVHGRGALRKALTDAPAGSVFRPSRTAGVTGMRANDRTYTKRLDGLFEGRVTSDDGTSLGVGPHTIEQVMKKMYGSKGLLSTPNDQRITHSQEMNARALQNFRSKSVPSREKAKRLRNILNLSNKDQAALRAIDLAWSDAARAGALASRQGKRKPPVKRAQAKIMHRQIQNLQKQAGVKATGHADAATRAEIARRAARPGHYRAKAVLAALNGHGKKAARLTRKTNAVREQRQVIKQAQRKIARVGAAPKPQKTWTKHTTVTPPTPPRAVSKPSPAKQNKPRPAAHPATHSSPATSKRAAARGVRKIALTRAANKRKQR